MPAYEQQHLKPPKAPIIPHQITIHGEVLRDYYAGLKDKENPQVKQYLEAENNYTDCLMEPTRAVQQKIYQEMLSRTKEDDCSFPSQIGYYYYYYRFKKGKQYPVYCRKKKDKGRREEVLLDPNLLFSKNQNVDVRVAGISPNHQFLTYSVDLTGREDFTLFIKDLVKDSLRKDKLICVSGSVVWSADSKSIFYVALDEKKRASKLYRHLMGTGYERDVLVYEEKDEAFSLWLSSTKDKEYIILNSNSNNTTEGCYLRADSPEKEFTLVKIRSKGVEYYLEHRKGWFYILTNEYAGNFKVVKTKVSDVSKQKFKEVIPPNDAQLIEGMEIFQDYLILYERKEVLPHIHVVNLADNSFKYIEFDEPFYSIKRVSNPDFTSAVLNFNYSSFITPSSIFEYNLRTGKKKLKNQDKVAGYNPSAYAAEHLQAEAPDGTKVPISLYYKKNFKKKGKLPLYLSAYGAYGFSLEPRFYPESLSLIDRGFIFAIAQVRGGGEKGNSWYEAGKLLHKKNSFTDFIACDDYLIKKGYTSKEKLVIEGSSAGGLLIAAVLNLRPDLFKAAILKYPFVDVLNTMLDADKPLVLSEYEEWGNPQKKEYYDYIKSYSPYDNVEKQKYPHLLIIAGLNDTRVGFFEALKWAAKLRAVKKDKNMLILKILERVGHRGVAGRYNYLQEIAFEYSFIFHLLGISV